MNNIKDQLKKLVEADSELVSLAKVQDGKFYQKIGQDWSDVTEVIEELEADKCYSGEQTHKDIADGEDYVTEWDWVGELLDELGVEDLDWDYVIETQWLTGSNVEYWLKK